MHPPPKSAVNGDLFFHRGPDTKSWNIKRCPDSVVCVSIILALYGSVYQPRGKRQTVNYFVHITHVPQLRQEHLVTVPEITVAPVAPQES